ncbi:hypothetical protein [Spirosoma sp. KNUC1025]|uniref:hypothetical protein n=1 Tax=Spirosoma sp. KNUC1025 TaxID=2894082 RepID=UPI00386EBD94|nr:hypothetical protein LN737_25255 [Spirosoma sp. KNUC1025]
MIAKKFNHLLIYCSSILITFTIVYLSFNVDLKGYVQNSLEIISGYKKAMQIYEDVDYMKYYIAALFAALLFCLQLYRLKRELFSYQQLAKLLLIMLAFYYCFSYSFTRGAAALFFKCSIVSVVVFLSIYLTKDNVAKNRFYTLTIFILSFGFFNYFYNDFFTVTNWHPSQYTQPIPARLLDKAKTYDVYPYQTSLVYFNDLLYHPRPIIQSYSAYTPALDRINADFFAQKQVDNILFHTSVKNLPWGNTIDERYFMYEEPLAKIEILKNYAVTGKVNDSLFIAGKRKTTTDIKFKLLTEHTYSLGEPIDLSSLDSTKLYFFTTDFNYSSKAKLASLLYKFPYISVELTTTDHKTIKFNTVSDLLVSHSVLNKYCSNFMDYFSLIDNKKFSQLKTIQTIRFIPNQRGYSTMFAFKIFEATRI